MWRRALLFLDRPHVTRIVLAGLLGLVLLSLTAVLVRDWDQVVGWLHYITMGLLLKAFAVYTLALALAALTWYLIMYRLSGTADMKTHLRVYCVTNLARRLPGVLWHVVGRAVLYEQVGLSKKVTLLASGVEQVLVLLSGALVYLVSLAATHGSSTLVNITWSVVAVLVGGVMVHPRLISAVLHRWGQKEAFSVRYRDLAMWLVLYIVIWIIGGYIVIILVDSNQPLSLVEQVEIIGAWSLSGGITSLATFLPGGLGLREVSLVVLLAPSIGWPFAAFVAIVLRLLLTFFEIIWGAIAWRMGRSATVTKKGY